MKRAKEHRGRGRRIRAIPAIVAIGIAVGFAAASADAGSKKSREKLPPGVEQIIPRGTLAAVFDPVLVPAEKSGLPDDAWILGVVIDGEAHAYSLNLLNHHEVVNDRIGDHPFAAVW